MEHEYIELLKKRAKESKVYSPHQMTGLLIAEILGDNAHKALYIKLAKDKNPNTLLELAKDVSDRDNIKNKGAYFMKMLKELRLRNTERSTANVLNKPVRKTPVKLKKSSQGEIF